jgi:hypothetical protein
VEGVFDSLQDGREVVEDLVIPEAQDAETGGLQKQSTHVVVGMLFGVSVVVAVEFDNYASGDAGEIGDVFTDGVLAAKFVAG